ncbi:MAG: prolyl oligopeptidase family serine peptidase [Rhizomicrobium sp.]
MRRGTWLAAAGLLLAVAAKGAVSVEDPYLWLEDVHGAEPLAWVAEQNARTRAVLQADPRYQQDHDAVLKVLDATDRIPYGTIVRDTVFNFWQDAANPKGVWRRTTLADYASPSPHWETIIDVDKLAADEHENWIWKGGNCTNDLKRCLVFLSRDGGDAHVIREFDLATKTFVKDRFALAHAKSDASWLDDDTVLFSTDFGPGTLTKSGYPRIVKLWHRGAPIDAAKTLLEGKPEDIAVSTQTLNGTGGVYAMIVRGVSFFENEYHHVAADGTVTKIDLPLSAVIQGMTGKYIVFTLRKEWKTPGNTYPQGALVAMNIDGGAPRTLYVPGPRSTVEEVATGRDAVYASIFDNVTGSIHVFKPLGSGDWEHSTLDLPANGSTHVVATNDFGPQAMFTFESYLKPSTLYLDKGDGKPAEIKALPPRFDSAGLVTEQFQVASSDGVMIPYFVTRPKASSGPVPTVLYGYGGFEISLTPSYSANFGMLWMAHGGIYVVANIRGGGEFGPAWHEAARFENHQRAFDDFAAVARDLVKRGFTTPKQLGIVGGSNGGLLVSASMVEHPELFGAVICQVPLIDMIRFTQIGAGQSWADEYGDPADPKARAYIEKYSPYQNVKPDVKYPPILFTTATSDDRVTPVHARKMAAKMEAFGDDVLFFENTDGGHSAGANHKLAAEMWALSFVYLKQKLGL